MTQTLFSNFIHTTLECDAGVTTQEKIEMHRKKKKYKKYLRK